MFCSRLLERLLDDALQGPLHDEAREDDQWDRNEGYQRQAAGDAVDDGNEQQYKGQVNQRDQGRGREEVAKPVELLQVVGERTHAVGTGRHFDVQDTGKRT